VAGSNTVPSTATATAQKAGGPTLVVAASNAKYPSRADYVCTGTNDQTTINAALAALPVNNAGQKGGRVLLTEGDYSLGGTINVASFQSLHGTGWGTRMRLVNGANCWAVTFIPDATGSNNAQGIEVGSFTVDGNSGGQNGGLANGTASGGITMPGANRCVVDHVFFVSCYTAGIDLPVNPGTGAHPWENEIHSCLVTLGQNSPDAANSGFGFNLHDAEENSIHSNYFEFNGKAHIIDNVVGNNSITNNAFVNGNVGIQTGGSRGRIANNVFDSLSGHNIRCTGNSNDIHDNAMFLIGAGAAANAASGITLNWGATGNDIHDNTIISHSTNGQTRWFIDDNADWGNNTVNNMIHDNILHQAGTMGSGWINATQPTTILRGNRVLNDNAGGAVLMRDTASQVATVPVGATSVVVTHGMGMTPKRIGLTPTTDPQQRYWADTITATTFTIRLAAAAATSAPSFVWRATYSDDV